jgi:hypothetical protein
MAARSRWRWTIVVVRQSSFVATSLNHPPAGIRSGVERAALSMQSQTGRPALPGFVSGVGLLSVVMALSPGPPVSIPAPEGWYLLRTVHSSPFAFQYAGKKGPPGKAFRRIPSQGLGSLTRGRVYGCPAYCRGTHTLIRKSAGAAHIIVKYAGYGARTGWFNP